MEKAVVPSRRFYPLRRGTRLAEGKLMQVELKVVGAKEKGIQFRHFDRQPIGVDRAFEITAKLNCPDQVSKEL